MHELVEQMKAGIALVRAGRMQPPPMRAHLRRSLYPLAVAVALGRAVWGNGPLRRRYLGTMIPQVLLVLVAGVGWTMFMKEGERAALSLWARLLSLYTAMSIFEAVIIAFTREHHDGLSYAVSAVVGAPPEEDIARPRVRLDVDWLVTKMKRRVQGGIILLVSVLPFGVLISVAVAPIALALADRLGGRALVAFLANAPAQLFVLVAGAYWLGVFTLGKTAHAWRDEIVSDPFFLRWSDAAADAYPRLCGWLHLYTRVLRRALGRARRPAHVVEAAMFETGGLVLLRVLISAPGLYLLLRPLIPVAATVVIAARSPETLSGLPVSLVLDERLQ